MPQKSWHKRVQSAVKRLIADYDSVLLEPCVIYLRTKDNRVVHYEPDCVSIYGNSRSNLDLVIWEIETNPHCKSVAGAVSLASMCRTSSVELYPYLDGIWREKSELATKITAPIRFDGLYDRRLKRVIRPGERVMLDKPKYISFVLICCNDEDRVYFERYVQLTAEQRPKPFWDYATVVCTAASEAAALNSLKNNGDIRRIMNA